MAKLYNLARMTTATTGTGTVTLGSAVSGYLTFALAGVSNGDVVDYAIKDGSNSENGTGTYSSSGTTLTRTPTKSTNANAAINLSGAAEVFISPRAETLNDASLLTTGTLDPGRLSGTVTAHGVALFEGAGTALGNTGAGTAGQTLVSNGSGSDPSFKSGGWVLLNTLTASSSANLQDTTNFTSAYSDYEIVLENIVNGTTGTNLLLQVHSGGSFQTSGYVSQDWVGSGASGAGESSVTTGVTLGRGSSIGNAAPGYSGTVRGYNITASGIRIWTAWFTYLITGGGAIQQGTSGGYWNTSALIDGIQIAPTSGVITSGTVKIYGRN